VANRLIFELSVAAREFVSVMEAVMKNSSSLQSSFVWSLCILISPRVIPGTNGGSRKSKCC